MHIAKPSSDSKHVWLDGVEGYVTTDNAPTRGRPDRWTPTAAAVAG